MQHSSSSRIYQEDLAYIHDAGFGDLARGAAPAIIDTLRSSGLTHGTVVELGCGSGILLASLLKAGYRVVGIDSSEQMLELARAKAPTADLRCESVYDSALPPCLAVVATGEALNYETPGQSNLDRLSSLVTRVFGALQNGGIFLFDAILRPPDTATQYKTWRTGADWAVLIEARQSDPDLIEKQIITFRRAGNNYRRNEETHFVRLFRREAVEQLLIDSGFSVEIRAGYGTDRLLPGRRLFEARRPR